MKVSIDKLTPHPLNHRIYGNEDNLSELVEKIKSSGWIKPILITSNNIIISGHRRVETCKVLGITEIECEIVDDDPVKQLELFVAENFYRVKTTTQLMKEADIYQEIEQHKAYQRKVEIGKQNLGQSSEEVNWNQLGETGRTSQIVSRKIGMSESSFKRAKSVKEFVKNHPNWEWIFEETMNQSVDGSVKLKDKSPEFIEKLIERVKGDKGKILPTIREMEKQEQKSDTPLPPGQYGVVIFDFTNRHTDNLLNPDISSICEVDCILFMWVRPHQVGSGLNIGKNWGFRYCTCMLWSKDKENQVSTNGELLMVMVKGSPKVNFKFIDSSPEKPEIVEQIIKEEYQGWSTVELFTGEGWKIW